MSLKFISSLVVFTSIYFSSIRAQSNEWTEPVPIDSTRNFYSPLIAVSPKGQISTFGSDGFLYISDDKGKSFELRYEFKPEAEYYRIFTPLGLAYDSSSVLWMYFVWEVCDNEWCDFPRQQKLYLSKSTDGGFTFEHLLQFDGYQFLARFQNEANPAMYIEKDNTIHFLRDTAWYMENFIPAFSLIYTKISEAGEKTEMLLSEISDILELSNYQFNMPADGKPIVLITTVSRLTSNLYWFYTKYNGANFSPYRLLDSLKGGELARLKLNSFDFNKTFLTYWNIKYEPEEKFFYYRMISENGGETFNNPVEVTEDKYNINHFDGSYYYSIDYHYYNHSIMYYKYNDIFSTPVDYFNLGSYGSVVSYIDRDTGGKYLIVTTQNKSFFIGKDIITSIELEPNDKEFLNDIFLNIKPNPFNLTATISYNLPHESDVELKIYDIMGREVKSFNINSQTAGTQSIFWDGTNENGIQVASGIYIYRIVLKSLENNEMFVKTAKLMMLK